jgi:hypothetical protein
MSCGVATPPQPFRWALTGRRRTWHALLPTAAGTYYAALCGYRPGDGWGPLLAAPPRLPRQHACLTCRTFALRQGSPVY